MKRFAAALLSLIFAAAAVAQIAQLQLQIPTFPVVGVYTVSKTTSLSGAAEIITVQGVSANSANATAATANLIAFQSASVTCSAACTFTVERDGTPATTTSQVPTGIDAQYPASTATAYNTSNVGSGTVLSAYQLPAAGTITLNLMGKTIRTGGSNFSIRTNSITATVNINIQYAEVQRTVNPD